MRVHALILTSALVLTACEGAPPVVASSAASIPAAVACGDAPGLRQQAAADRRQVDDSRSDHERISAGSRANFFAALAVIADLKCQGLPPAADADVNAALQLAGKADTTNSVYEKTRSFHEASFLATRAIEMTVRPASTTQQPE
jgi:hypothetical protein